MPHDQDRHSSHGHDRATGPSETVLNPLLDHS